MSVKGIPMAYILSIPSCCLAQKADAVVELCNKTEMTREKDL